VLLVAAAAALAWLWPDTAGADEAPSERWRSEGEIRAPQVVAERAWLQPGAAGPQDASGRPITDLTGFSYRWWARHGRANIGIGLGTVAFVDPGADASGLPGALRGAVPTFTVGWRYRVSPQAAVYADATSAHSLVAAVSPDLYNTKVGVEWQPAKSRFGFEGRSLGVQLQSGYHMSLRARKGGIAVYFRGKF
jgi:hypothetical protein